MTKLDFQLTPDYEKITRFNTGNFPYARDVFVRILTSDKITFNKITMKMINYLTMAFSFVSMLAMLIILFRTNMGADLIGTKTQGQQTEKSYVTAKIYGEVPDSAAENMTRVFRNANPSNQTKVILHDTSDLMDYMRKNFMFYTMKIPVPSGFECKLGMVPMYFTDNGVDKLTISFLPTLVEKAHPDNVIDYWMSKKANDIYYKSYYQPLLKAVKDAGFKSFIFDEGQLWP